MKKKKSQIIKTDKQELVFDFGKFYKKYREGIIIVCALFCICLFLFFLMIISFSDEDNNNADNITLAPEQLCEIYCDKVRGMDFESCYELEDGSYEIVCWEYKNIIRNRIGVKKEYLDTMYELYEQGALI